MNHTQCTTPRVFSATSTILNNRFGTFVVADVSHQTGMSLEALSFSKQSWSHQQCIIWKMPRSGCLRGGDSNADFTSLDYILVQVWEPNQGQKEAGFAIMRNANIWELGGFKTAATTGKCLRWWEGSATAGIRLNLCWGAAKIWQMIYGLFTWSCLFLCYITIKPMRDETAESFLFAWYRQGWHIAWPWRWWRESKLVPRKGWSPCRETQLLDWGNPGRKTIFAAGVWIANSINFYSDSFWFFSVPKGSLFSSAHNTWLLNFGLFGELRVGKRAGRVPWRFVWLEVGLPRETPAPVGTGLLQVAGSPVSSQTERALLPPARTCSGLAWTPCAPLLGHSVSPSGRQRMFVLSREGLQSHRCRS